MFSKIPTYNSPQTKSQDLYSRKIKKIFISLFQFLLSYTIGGDINFSVNDMMYVQELICLFFKRILLMQYCLNYNIIQIQLDKLVIIFMHPGFSIPLFFSLGNALQRIIELIIAHTVLSSRRRFFGSYMEVLTLLLEFPSVIITKPIS